MYRFLVLILLPIYSLACDICGCSIASSSIGILPNYQNHFIGLKHQYTSFESYHPDDRSYSQEYFNRMELLGRYMPSKYLQLYATIPFVYQTQYHTPKVNQVISFADPTLMALYQVFNRSIDSSERWKHQWQLGGGVKLPLASYQIVQNYNTLAPSFQPGTGSWDFLINSIYILRYHKTIMNIDLSVKINTQNDLGYLFGNRYQLNYKLLHLFELKKSHNIMPHIGLLYIHASHDTKKSIAVDYTGNKSLLFDLGAQYFNDQFSFGINFQKIITQNINSQTSQQNLMANIQIIYFINQKK